MAWNFTICSSASSLLKLSNKNHAIDQVLGMTAAGTSPSVPHVLPSSIHQDHSYNNGGGEGRISPKRAYYAAFEAQMAADEMGDEEEMMMFAAAGAGGETGAAAAAALLKKRRLTMEQVRYLESSFESENKLEPERKAEIARQLGLQPRQVAVWFQNRRARSKSKQLERDYNALKADYDAVLKENEELRAEVQRLNDLLQEGDSPQRHAEYHEPAEKSKRRNTGINASGAGAEPDQQGKHLVQVVVETSTMSGAVVKVPGNELGDGEESMSSPCTLLTDYMGNAGVPSVQAAAAAVVVVPNDHVSVGLEELLNNCMHGAQQFNLYAQWPDSSFHHMDNSLLIASWEEDDPFSHST